MPKSMFYHANAIVYFQGDNADRIFVLKEGKVELSYKDIQTGEEVREPVQTGEFFAVKAAMGRYDHMETATAITDCTVVHFSIAEFEGLVSANPRILMKMLQVFSTQLRRIHHQVQSLLSTEEAGTNPEAGLFAVGEYYLQEKQYAQAAHAFKNYLKHWPTGSYAPQATLKIGEAETALESQPADSAPGVSASYGDPFTQSELHYRDGRYKDAMKGYMELIKRGSDTEHLAEAEFKIGMALYHLDRYDDSLKQLAAAIRKHPKYPRLGEAIYFMGLGHGKMDDEQKAAGFVQKALQMVPQDDPLYQEILKTAEGMEL